MAPMTTTVNAAHVAAHRTAALDYLEASQSAQAAVDDLYRVPAVQRTAEQSALIGGFNAMVRFGLKAAQVHATLATIPVQDVDAEPEPPEPFPCPVPRRSGRHHFAGTPPRCACGAEPSGWV